MPKQYINLNLKLFSFLKCLGDGPRSQRQRRWRLVDRQRRQTRHRRFEDRISAMHPRRFNNIFIVIFASKNIRLRWTTLERLNENFSWKLVDNEQHWKGWTVDRLKLMWQEIFVKDLLLLVSFSVYCPRSDEKQKYGQF